MSLTVEKHRHDKIEDWMQLEKEGRRRAYNREAPPYGDVEFLKKIKSAAKTISGRFFDLDLPRDYWLLADLVGSVADESQKQVRECIVSDTPRKDCVMAKRDDDTWRTEKKGISYAFYDLEMADEASKRLIGRRCTYLRGSIDPYNESAFLNDLTACFHVILDAYRDKVANWQFSGKCAWRVV